MKTKAALRKYERRNKKNNKKWKPNKQQKNTKLDSVYVWNSSLKEPRCQNKEKFFKKKKGKKKEKIKSYKYKTI